MRARGGGEGTLAELDVRHTLRHMPVRRVALGPCRIPANGSFGAALLACVVSSNVGLLDREQRIGLTALLRDAAHGLTVPRLSMRHRLQVDTHGLDRSRHRLLGQGTTLVAELDVHAHHPAPQIIGAVMAAATLPIYPRRIALFAMERAMQRPDSVPEGMTLRLVSAASERILTAPPAGGNGRGGNGRGPGANGWAAGWRSLASAEALWALDVLGFPVEEGAPGREEIQRRFRHMVRLAHPDHGATSTGAAERMAELGEARRLLLATVEGRPPA